MLTIGAFSKITGIPRLNREREGENTLKIEGVDPMSNKKMEKIYIAVQDIRTLAARTRPNCDHTRDCSECPAKIALTEGEGSTCLFELCQR